MFQEFEEELKALKRALQVSEVDGKSIKSWFALYEKVKKQAEITAVAYEKACQSVLVIQDKAKGLEKLLVDTSEWNSSALHTLQSILADLKKMQGNYEHEFLVGKDHDDYQTTYRSILHLGETFDGKDKIIFQSEVENLISMNTEIIERPQPNYKHLGFFEVNREVEDLSDLPYQEKIRKIGSLYENDFVRPFQKLVLQAMEQADRCATEGFSGWRANRQKEAFQIFLYGKENTTIEERTNALIEGLRTQE